MNSIKIIFENGEKKILSYSDFQQFKNSIDINHLDPKKEGRAVYLSEVLKDCKSNFISLEASSDAFFASVKAAALLEHGLIIFEKNGRALAEKEGGPFRFYIPNPKACKTDELDECVNVKYLDRIVLSKHIGKDSRPKNSKEHHELHEKQA